MAKHPPQNIRHRVNLLLAKLSDRDTEPMAAAELTSIARTLTAGTLTAFISAVGDTRAADKTPLRRHSLRLLSLLPLSLPPSSVSPHLPRILTAVLRHIRDTDSSVRAALTDAVRSLAAASPESLFIPAILRPLVDKVFHEQDLNSQLAAANALSAALEVSNKCDISGYLHCVLPRLVRLVRGSGFKAKAALLAVMGGAVAAGGVAGDEEILKVLVECFVEFVGSEDWGSRKAAVEGLMRVGVEEKGRLGGLKICYLGFFESRRYDKVKIVRESMNRMIEVWKEIPETDQNPSELQPNSLKENATDGSSSSPFSVKRNRKLSSRSPPPTSPPIPSVKKIVHLNSDLKKNAASSRRINQAKNSNWKIEVSVPDAGVNERSNFEARRVLFEKNCEEKKMDGVKFGAKVAPLMENGSLEVNCEDGDEIIVEQKDSDLALIRMQLAQIEKQQSTLLEILQKFIVSSQNGITSLEARVNILETTLEGMSRGLAAPPSGGVAATKTCCSLPGAEFLSSRLWRRAESRYASRFLLDPCSRGRLQFATKRLQENGAGDAVTGSKFGQNG